MKLKETLRNICPESLHQMYADTKFWIRFKFFPQGIASELFRGILGYEMNWENPTDINEKINWMKFHYDTSEWSRLADKYLVREYVKERIGEEVLPRLYGVWEKAEDIDFDQLPKKFVLKTNQGCATVMLVEDKAKLDTEETRKTLNEWVKMRYGRETMEPHYLKIHPVITAEEYLECDTSLSSSLIDYKVFCTMGKPQCILVCKNRHIGVHADFSFYDCSWHPLPEVLAGRHKGEFSETPKPECLQQMLAYAERLAEGHPQVRVDFYIVKGRIYFGEMTFTSQGGYMDYMSRDFSRKLGMLVKL